MIKVRVKSLWQGQVGIRDKYIRQARAEKVDGEFFVADLEINGAKYKRIK